MKFTKRTYRVAYQRLNSRIDSLQLIAQMAWRSFGVDHAVRMYADRLNRMVDLSIRIKRRAAREKGLDLQ